MFMPIEESGQRYGVHAIGKAPDTGAAACLFLNHLNMILSLRHHHDAMSYLSH
jgi:hypothetical protein